MNQERVFSVLLGPHVSEKTAIATEMNNQYTFRVAPDASKLEIRRAVEKLFKVKVANVQVLNVKGKVKMNRFGAARRSDWKKAYVRLESGHDIDFTVTD
ncbi:MAG: 50S ribosomal protein L23 [Gammaproteobacteria bacterium]|jgi:large subunit ribosomal protein L23|nr:50S ribosomal protein L23 [Gammaproteobacteria bacterium]MBK7518617.1 50S ribosomal protein L23 [Gammaproteobacteria bacterium]MBK7727010.1 50S ribosomal protein L23 [Gammaproteobacteria bacterium]MBK8307407.1 50S ribosomal protein L23 [Gammaproteobacteria bacterium]MBK9665141.1 50S ribosomal protein L23 [Gammaproteobacteria bacterium]